MIAVVPNSKTFTYKEAMPSNPKKLTAATMLCQCLSGALGQSLLPSSLPTSEERWASLLRLSGDHLVTPVLRWALRDQKGLYDELPPSVVDYLEAVYALNLEKNLSCEDQLSELISDLNKIEVRPVLLKGAAMLVGGLYPTSGERMITDLDILIPEERLSEVLVRMLALGYQSTEGTIDLAEVALKALSHRHHYPALVHRDWPVSIELHVQPVVSRYLPLLASEDVLSGARKAVLPGGECLLPDPTKMIIHNVVHAFLFDTMDCMKTISLRQLFEFVLISQKYRERVDWDQIKQRFDGQGYGRRLRQYLLVAEGCFGLDATIERTSKHYDILSMRPYLDVVRLNMENSAAIWVANLFCQLTVRQKRLVREPQRIRRLMDSDFYAKLLDSIFRR